MNKTDFPKDLQYYKFCLYGFLKNLKFFDPFIILFFREIGFSFFQIGIFFATREITTNIMELPTGIIADSFGKKRSMIICFLSYIISFLIFYFFPKFSIYILAMIFFGIGEAFRTGTHKAMIFEYLDIKGLEKHKINYYGNTRRSSQLGAAFSTIVAAVLIFYTGSYRIIFLASTLPYLLDLFLITSYPRELDIRIEKDTKRGPTTQLFLKVKSTIKDSVKIFKNTYSLKAIINSSLFDGIFKSVKDYLQPILKTYAILIPIFVYIEKEKRISIVIGVVYFFLYILNSFASGYSGRFVKKIKSVGLSINISYIIGAVIILFSGIAYYLELYIVAILLFVILYFIENLRRPITVAYTSDLIPKKIMATGLSSESQFKTIFVAIFSIVLGYLADLFGIGIAIGVISSFLFFAYPIIRIKGSLKREDKKENLTLRS